MILVLLDDLTPAGARRNRYLQNLDDVKDRGRGLWKDSLWRTYDLLKRLGYTGYNFLAADLDRWHGKLRPGGILCGHDYLDGDLPSGRFEVKSTVDAWAAQRGLTVVTTGEHVWRSWLIRAT